MNTPIKRFLLTAGILALIAQSCKPNLEAPTPGAGEADFSNYVSVGNSLTAGYMSNGLSYEGQANSYPSILAKAMQATGKGPASFVQPLFPVGSPGSGHFVLLGIDSAGLPNIDTIGHDLSQTVGAIQTQALGKVYLYKNVDANVQLNNLGVPGISVADVLTPGYGFKNGLGFNTYYERMLPDELGALPYISFVARSKPTFFTNWLGNNDVLGYASNGGVGTLTDMATFSTNYNKMLDTLMLTAKKGLVATIPNVLAAPYFTTVPVRIVPLTSQGQVDGLNTLIYGIHNRKADTLNHPEWKINFALIPNNLPVIEDRGDPALASIGYIRQLNPEAGELLTLQASQILGTATSGGHIYGVDTTLPDAYSLTRRELDAIAARTKEINDFIKGQAASRNLALFDSETFLDQVKAGTVYFDGTQITADFITGGAFSLDGVHPTARGYALIANQMMAAINAKYGSSLSPVNAVDYPGLTFPK